jgi:hypothetical protein
MVLAKICDSYRRLQPEPPNLPHHMAQFQAVTGAYGFNQRHALFLS